MAAQLDEHMHVLMMRDLMLIDISDGSTRTVRIEILEPIPVEQDWAAWFSIRDLPEPGDVYRFRGMQVDKMGAVIDAMYLLCAKLIASDEYKAGCLFWMEPGDKCGLPTLANSPTV